MRVIATLIQQLEADYELHAKNEFRLEMSFKSLTKGTYSNL